MDDVIYRHSTLGIQTQPIATYYGHQNSSFYIKSSLSRDDGLLLSGSGDGKAYIWNVRCVQNPWKTFKYSIMEIDNLTNFYPKKLPKKKKIAEKNFVHIVRKFFSDIFLTLLICIYLMMAHWK